MSERLTRKEIKQDIREDEVQSFLITAVERVMERPKFYASLLGGLLCAGLVVVGVVNYLESRADQSSQELAEAMKVYGAEVDPDNADPDDPTTPIFASKEARAEAAKAKLASVQGGISGDVAQLYQADLALAEGDAAKAREIWLDFLGSHSEHALALSVRLNLMALDRAEGKAEEVAEELQTQLDSAVKELPEDVILFELAQTRDVLGQTEEARELYQRLVDEYPQSPYTAEARRFTAS